MGLVDDGCQRCSTSSRPFGEMFVYAPPVSRRDHQRDRHLGQVAAGSRPPRQRHVQPDAVQRPPRETKWSVTCLICCGLMFSVDSNPSAVTTTKIGRLPVVCPNRWKMSSMLRCMRIGTARPEKTGRRFHHRLPLGGWLHPNLRRAGDRHEHHFVLRIERFEKRRDRRADLTNGLPDRVGGIDYQHDPRRPARQRGGCDFARLAGFSNLKVRGCQIQDGSARRSRGVHEHAASGRLGLGRRRKQGCREHERRRHARHRVASRRANSYDRADSYTPSLAS